MFRINFKPCMNKCTEWIGTVGFQHNPAQCPLKEINQLQNDKFSAKVNNKKEHDYHSTASGEKKHHGR